MARMQSLKIVLVLSKTVLLLVLECVERASTSTALRAEH